MTAELHRRWPGRVADVLGIDEPRGWLLTAGAGRPIEWSDDSVARWLDVLPRYAELQMGERAHAADHLRRGVPDLRLEVLPERFGELVAADLPLDAAEVAALGAFAPRFASLLADLARHGPAASVQHDDLHGRSVLDDGVGRRVTDWGDASIGQPLFSLVRLDLSLGETVGPAGRDRWFPRLRDAYLEPWGAGMGPAFELAHRLGVIAHTFTWHRHWNAMRGAVPEAFAAEFAKLLRRALTRAGELGS